jgi:hypothetical protein
LVFADNGTDSFAIGRDNTNGDFVIAASGALGTSNLINIESGGNVGIGTTAPDSILHLETTTNPTLSFYRNDADGILANNPIGTLQFGGSDAADTNDAVIIKAEADAAWGASSCASRLVFGTTPTGSTSASERMRIDGDGNVGIGTTDPKSLLDVGGAETSANVDDGNLVVKTTATNDSAIVIQEASGSEQFALGVNSNGDFVITDSGSTVPFFIGDQTGNVGIGTDNPSDLLDVRGGGADTYIRVGSDTVAGNDAARIGKIDSSTDFVIQASLGTTASETVFKRNTTAETMRIDSSGNVGIGTDSPSELLHVYEGTSSDSAVLKLESTTNVNTDPVGEVQFFNTAAGNAEVAGYIKLNTWNLVQVVMLMLIPK